MTETFTPEQADRLRTYLATHELCAGLGTEESACSLAAVNIAISGRLTADIPPCMSEMIGRPIIVLQDAMPHQMRNSPEWKAALVRSVGTGRERERERMAVLLDWMWGTALPSVQNVADAGRFGDQWRAMCNERTEAAARAAAAAADAAAHAAARAAAWAAEAAATAARARTTSSAAAAHAAARAAAAAAAWTEFDPAALIERMIDA